MASKPDKFGINFWIVADAKSKYMFNAIPYLGKDPTRPRNVDVPHDVCMKLLTPLYNQGYHVTTDNYFTSEQLAASLKIKQITLLGTIRKQRREIPKKCEFLLKDKPLFTSLVFRSQDNITLTAYKVKRSKVVYLLSTLHNTVSQPSAQKTITRNC